MAATVSHAAGQERYEVREILEGQALGNEVRHECRDYVQAVEFAFEFLQRRDPSRCGRMTTNASGLASTPCANGATTSRAAGTDRRAP